MATMMTNAGNGNTAGRSYYRGNGQKVIEMRGPFDGATAVLAMSRDGGTTYTAYGSDGTLTAPGVIAVQYAGELLRWEISGGGGSTALTATIN